MSLVCCPKYRYQESLLNLVSQAGPTSAVGLACEIISNLPSGAVVFAWSTAASNKRAHTSLSMLSSSCRTHLLIHYALYIKHKGGTSLSPTYVVGFWRAHPGSGRPAGQLYHVIYERFACCLIPRMAVVWEQDNKCLVSFPEQIWERDFL